MLHCLLSLSSRVEVIVMYLEWTPAFLPHNMFANLLLIFSWSKCMFCPATLWSLILIFQLNKMLIEKVQPYIQKIDNNVLPGPILQPQTSSEKKVFLFFLVLFCHCSHCLGKICIATHCIGYFMLSYITRSKSFFYILQPFLLQLKWPV